MASAPKTVKLQVNTSGAWRDVMTFDCEDEAPVLAAASELFSFDGAHSNKLRVIIPGDTAPLMNWTRKDGWRAWRAAA